MISIKNAFQAESLQRYKEPGMLFGGGLLAGLLLFLVWLAFASLSDVESEAIEPGAAAAAAQGLKAGDKGVLNGLTAGSSSGQVRAVSAPPTDVDAVSDATAAAGSADAGAEVADQGPAESSPVAPSEGDEITSGLLGPDEPATPEPAPDAAPEAEVSEPAKN
jgi:hypothetical protein